MDEKWNVKLVFEVEGKEVYINTSEWKNIDPKKVAMMEQILAEAQAKFVAMASGVKI